MKGARSNKVLPTKGSLDTIQWSWAATDLTVTCICDTSRIAKQVSFGIKTLTHAGCLQTKWPST
jgi:hypothetical protein